jgi:ATP-binding cassette subfamily F protein uup
LSYREQQEWDGMEVAILAAEQTVVVRQAAVDRAAQAGHVALAEACHALEDAQREVERLYARWQELEAKRGP